VTCGIATDKLQTLTGDANMRIEIVTSPQENIFERMNRLHAELTNSAKERLIQATVIEPPVPTLTAQ
jgi:hypothetical protein